MKLKGFDGIRGLAVLSVIVTHTGIWRYLERRELISYDIVMLVHGSTGVQAFFVLSGFLITMLLMLEYEKNNKISLYNFYVRRTLRIMPLYFFCMFLVTLLHIFGNHVANWNALLHAYTYTYNFISRENYSRVLGHTWSLAVEEHFYLIWPIVFSAFYAVRKKGLTVGLIVFSLFSIVTLNIFTLKYTLGEVYFIARWSFIAGNGIALGCLGALLLCGKAKGFWRRALGSKVSLAVSTVLFFNSLILSGDPFYIGWYFRSIGIALFVSYIYVNQSSKIISLLGYKWLSYIGVISYGMYMYQGIFMGTGPGRLPEQTWPPHPLIGLLLVIVVAPLSFHFFEKPILKLKGKYQKVD